MTNWWSGLSRRERILVGLLAALLAAGLVWYGGWQPVTHFHRAAASRHQQALEEKETVLALAARIRALGPTRTLKATRPVADIVRESLEAAGITPARIEPDPEGGVRVAVNAVPPTLLFPWIASLQTAHGITPRHLIVVKEGQGALGLDATLIDGGR